MKSKSRQPHQSLRSLHDCSPLSSHLEHPFHLFNGKQPCSRTLTSCKVHVCSWQIFKKKKKRKTTTTTNPQNSGIMENILVLNHRQTDFKTMLHNTCYGQGKNKQKSSPSVLSDAEVPRPVSPLSDVPGRCPKRLWNFSDTAGVCHSISAKRAVYNRTMATKEFINTAWTDTQLMHFDCTLSTYLLVSIQYISARLSFHTRQCHLIEEESYHNHTVNTLKRYFKRLFSCISRNQFDNSYHWLNSWTTLIM